MRIFSDATFIRKLTCLVVICCVHNAHGLSLVSHSSAPDFILSEGRDSTLHHAVVYAQPTETMTPSQHLSGHTLETLRGHSIADALRYFTGIQLKDYGGVGGLKTIDLRAMGSQHVGVFYDGLQIGNAQNGQVDLGRLSLDNIEQIDLYNGQKSHMLQSARDYGSGGTIYLQSRRPTFLPEGPRQHLNVAFSTGSFGLVAPSITWDHRLSDRVSLSANAAYTHATGRYPFHIRKFYPDGSLAYDTAAIRQNGDIESTRLEANIFGLREGGKWQAKVYAYGSQRGIPGAIVNNIWMHAQRQWDRNFFAQGSLRQQISPRYRILFSGKLAHDYLRYLNPDPRQMYVDNRFHQNEVYLSLAHEVELTDHWRISAATDGQYNTLSSDIIAFPHPHRTTLLASFATRYDFRNIHLMGSLLGSHIFDSTDHGSDWRINYTPALFLTYTPTRALSLRAFCKQHLRMPTFNDLYYTDIGNIALRPEKATQYDLGFLFNLPALQLKADAFVSQVTDKIIAVPKGSGQYRWAMMNIGKALIYGSELSTQITLPSNFSGDHTKQFDHGVSHPTTFPPLDLLPLTSLLVSYTYQRAEDRSNPADNDPVFGTYRGQIAYIPRHSVSITAYLDWRRFRINYSFIYAGERYHTSANIPANREQPWYTHDATLDCPIRIARHTLHIALECNNIFNQQYDVIQNYPMPGRNYRLTLRFVSR